MAFAQKFGPYFLCKAGRTTFRLDGPMSALESVRRLQMKTGDNTPLLGLYATDCCDYELILDTEQQFPRCLKCYRLSEWELIEQVFETTLLAA